MTPTIREIGPKERSVVFNGPTPLEILTADPVSANLVVALYIERENYRDVVAEKNVQLMKLRRRIDWLTRCLDLGSERKALIARAERWKRKALSLREKLRAS